jgi:RES domain-containing protein
MASLVQRACLSNINPERVPVLRLTGLWWRQTDPKYDALDLPLEAKSGGRCHRKGQQPLLYASSSCSAAWGELFRHVLSEVSPFEVIRRMSALEVVDLPTVDFDDPMIRALFGVSERMLMSNNYAVCRRLADLLRERTDLFGGFVLPSAAVAGEQTLIVFDEWMPSHLDVLDWTTTTAPKRLLRLFDSIVPTLSQGLQHDRRRISRELRCEIRLAAERDLERIRGCRR